MHACMQSNSWGSSGNWCLLHQKRILLLPQTPVDVEFTNYFILLTSFNSSFMNARPEEITGMPWNLQIMSTESILLFLCLQTKHTTLHEQCGYRNWRWEGWTFFGHSIPWGYTPVSSQFTGHQLTIYASLICRRFMQSCFRGGFLPLWQTFLFELMYESCMHLSSLFLYGHFNLISWASYMKVPSCQVTVLCVYEVH